ncbi:hypothetical protein Peur_045284 [Populus x canadensis]
MVDGWPMSSRYMMMAMKLLVPRDTVAGAEEVIVARPRKVAGESGPVSVLVGGWFNGEDEEWKGDLGGSAMYGG